MRRICRSRSITPRPKSSTLDDASVNRRHRHPVSHPALLLTTVNPPSALPRAFMAAMIFSGIPHKPKPPTRMVEPETTRCAASPAVMTGLGDLPLLYHRVALRHTPPSTRTMLKAGGPEGRRGGRERLRAPPQCGCRTAPAHPTFLLGLIDGSRLPEPWKESLLAKSAWQRRQRPGHWHRYCVNPDFYWQYSQYYSP